MCSVIRFSPRGPYASSGSFRPSTHGEKIRSGYPSVWSECRWVMKTIFSSFALSAANPFFSAAAARRTTPGPQSTRYARSFTTTATAGPQRSGSALGFPVPNTTTCARVVGLSDFSWAMLPVCHHDNH